VKDRVSFRDLAYVIVDEQHRFGVLERQALSGKSSPGGPADLLVMSATPIPRTLTLTLFGDLDVTRIAELPPGRQTFATRVLAHHERRIAYEALAAAVGRREQGFVVVPRIEADAARARSSLDAIARSLREKQRGWRVAVLHGALDGDHKELVARRLRSGDVDVVVATTVVEVGVDVPRATVMVVLEADRFGLAQLHQLRGRVGRSSLSASCHLVLSPEAGPAAAERLRVLETVSDGFQVAEVDWRERGPGDMTGARQWGGAGLRLAGVAELQAQIDAAREAATRRLQAIDGDEAEAFLRGWEERLRMVQVA
jgi:ATP-dependent DNA helicase RecG